MLSASSTAGKQPFGKKYMVLLTLANNHFDITITSILINRNKIQHFQLLLKY